MKRVSLLSLSIMLLSMLLTSCGGDMQLFWPTEDDKPDYAQGSQRGAGAPSRAPLDVPPELRDEIEVPDPGEIATKDGVMRSEEDKKLVAGKAVALDARIYETSTAAEVFSAVVDSMTALNLPVQSVDSPSGTLTTDWIRQASVGNEAVSTLTNMFGVGGARALRYRFVVRVLRQAMGETQVTRLEVRTIGQAFIGTSWVSKTIKRKVSNELFSAVDERLSK